MKILYINPGYSNENAKREVYVNVWAEHYNKILSEAAGAGTKVDVTNLGIKSEVNDTEFREIIRYNLTDIFKTVIESNKKGYDATIIGCASDPGVKEAKKMVNIPIIGPSEAGIYVSKLLGKKWSIILPGPFDKRKLTYPFMYPWIESIGLEKVSFRVSNVYGLQEVEKSIKKLVVNSQEQRDLILEPFGNALKTDVPDLVKSCVEEDGAEVILFGCTFWSGWKKEFKIISEKMNVLVLDPVIIALKVAESLANIYKS